MKIRNFLTILFAVLAIVALIALAGLATIYVADDSNPLRQRLVQIFDPDGETVAVSTPEAGTDAPAAETVKAHSFIFVGDSRTIGMRDAVNDNCTYIGKEGEGYEWFSAEGVQELDAVLAGTSGQTVIFNFGVNDPANISLYIDLYQSLKETYPGTAFYYLSVNPLVDNEGFNTTNEMISLFNATIQSAFPDTYLDCNSYLNSVGFETVDGLHYTDDSYKMIHNFVVDKIA
ncbi:MAG: SGNH/GDSL hydrolase family protein [Marvinbryantia sp.]|uniref:SGNH/GDSL hydrolase family protein n=1 Tax=Marvinbryantia sp. TaxID=2496532 RepID=UPI0025EA1B08|nr:hypothetical protein [uncultured Marvinbryantia sp.]